MWCMPRHAGIPNVKKLIMISLSTSLTIERKVSFVKVVCDLATILAPRGRGEDVDAPDGARRMVRVRYAGAQ